MASLHPHKIALSLKAEVHIDKIYLVGRRGARAEDLRGLFVEFLNFFNHPHVDYVVVDCGSNDIVHGTPALDVAATILEASQEFIYVHDNQNCSLKARCKPAGISLVTHLYLKYVLYKVR